MTKRLLMQLLLAIAVATTLGVSLTSIQTANAQKGAGGGGEEDPDRPPKKP